MTDKIEALLIETYTERNPWLEPVEDAVLDRIVAQTPVQGGRRPKPARRGPPAPETRPAHGGRAVDGPLAMALVAEANAAGGDAGLPMASGAHAEEPFMAFVDMAGAAAMPAEMAGQLADDNDDTEFEKHQQRELEYALMVDHDAGWQPRAAAPPPPPRTPRASVAHSARSPEAARRVEQALAALVASELMPEPTDSLAAAVFDEVEMRLAGDDPAAAKLVADIHAHITPSGAIGGEEILDRLLLEARRIQWERAAAAAAADGRPDAAAAPPPPRSADAAAASRRPGIVAKERGAKSSNRPLSQRERDLLAGVYRQINDSGAADAEGILDVLLSEALRIVERRTLALQAKL